MSLTVLEQAVCRLKNGINSDNLVDGSAGWREFKINLPQALLTCRSGSPNSNLSLAALIRDGLELACILQVKREDTNEFEKCYSLLEPLYVDYPEPFLPSSDNKAELCALQLLKFLVDGRAAEFHMLLQRIVPADRSHPHLQFVIDLERCEMSGNYEKALQTIKTPPSNKFNFMCSQLIDSARLRVADCLMKSHTEIPLCRAKQLLMLESDEDMIQFIDRTNLRNNAKANGDIMLDDNCMGSPRVLTSGVGTINDEEKLPFIKWTVTGDSIRFIAVDDEKNRTVPVDEIMNYVFGYVGALEKIV